MAATAPFCNVTVIAPRPGPTSPDGFRMLGPNATLQDVVSAFNNNFSPRVQQEAFDRLLHRDIQRGTGSRTGGFKTKPSQTRKAAQDEIKKISFVQKAIVRKKMKVTNPKNKDQFIIDDRVVSLILTDRRTGATWVFEDKQAAKGVAAGNEETQKTG